MAKDRTVCRLDVSQLRAYVVLLERIEADIRRSNFRKGETLDEAAACGFDKAALRGVVRLRAGDKPPEADDALLEVYEQACMDR